MSVIGVRSASGRGATVRVNGGGLSRAGRRITRFGRGTLQDASKAGRHVVADPNSSLSRVR